MAVYVDNFSCQDWERPARPVRHRQDTHQNKTAVNKGVWEFRTGLLGPPGLQLQLPLLQPVISRELVEFTPTNSYSHTIKRSRKPPILQV